MGSFISSRANMNESLAKKVEAEIVQHKVVIYSKTYCPYCVMAKDVFKEIKVEYHLVELDEHPEGSELQAILHKMTGARTVSW
ncbi:hypothetical protein QYM36_006713 [Artemia franciscana]|uniref:Glutaredoxin domain-containing protein n=1 Tax=Artemia franciscana TaxID=6661 RepID=A0AA88L9N1_ARTSF|nr:hypothetical protein QYM36_006713 [Artemia franciscana]